MKTDLERLVDPVTRGDPESPLRWTCKSVRKLSEGLRPAIDVKTSKKSPLSLSTDYVFQITTYRQVEPRAIGAARLDTLVKGKDGEDGAADL